MSLEAADNFELLGSFVRPSGSGSFSSDPDTDHNTRWVSLHSPHPAITIEINKEKTTP
jgi:hypothetical protein